MQTTAVTAVIAAQNGTMVGMWITYCAFVGKTPDSFIESVELSIFLGES